MASIPSRNYEARFLAVSEGKVNAVQQGTFKPAIVTTPQDRSLKNWKTDRQAEVKGPGKVGNHEGEQLYWSRPGVLLGRWNETKREGNGQRAVEAKDQEI